MGTNNVNKAIAGRLESCNSIQKHPKLFLVNLFTEREMKTKIVVLISVKDLSMNFVSVFSSSATRLTGRTLREDFELLCADRKVVKVSTVSS